LEQTPIDPAIPSIVEVLTIWVNHHGGSKMTIGSVDGVGPSIAQPAQQEAFVAQAAKAAPTPQAAPQASESSNNAAAEIEGKGQLVSAVA
jgi:hypothetical protein